jgi:hypothetical protein
MSAEVTAISTMGLTHHQSVPLPFLHLTDPAATSGEMSTILGLRATCMKSSTYQKVRRTRRNNAREYHSSVRWLEISFSSSVYIGDAFGREMTGTIQNAMNFFGTSCARRCNWLER